MKPLEWLKRYWRDHGTKVLGGLVVIAGGAGEALTYLQALDPKHAALWGFVIMFGGAVIRRGFGNSQRLQP